jgi:subtilisin family serine protease
LFAPFVDTFDGPALAGWATGGTSAWGRTTSTRVSGPYSITDSPAGNYQNNASSWIRRLQPVDLSAYGACGLEYLMRIESQWPDDGVMVQASTDPIWTPDDDLSGWSGSTNREFSWARDLLDLYEGASTLYIGFEFISDALGTRDGAYVDDLAIRCFRGPGVPSDYEIFDGTSMATPHVAGAAALVLAKRPNATVAELRQALLAGIDVLPSLAGRVATGGRLNVGRALGAGTAPPLPPPTRHLRRCHPLRPRRRRLHRRRRRHRRRRWHRRRHVHRRSSAASCPTSKARRFGRLAPRSHDGTAGWAE